MIHPSDVLSSQELARLNKAAETQCRSFHLDDQGPKHLRYILLHPKFCMNKNLDWGAEPGCKPKHFDMGYNLPKSCLDHCQMLIMNQLVCLSHFDLRFLSKSISYMRKHTVYRSVTFYMKLKDWVCIWSYLK